MSIKLQPETMPDHEALSKENLLQELQELREQNQKLTAQVKSIPCLKQKLKNTEASFDALLANAPHAMYEIDAQYTIINFNTEAENQFRSLLNRPLKIGSSILSYLVPSEHKKFQENVSLALQGEKMMYEWKYSDNVWFVIQFCPAYHKNGKITGVQIKELDLIRFKQSQIELAENKERFQSFARTASDPIFVVDQETLKIMFANPAACRNYGYSLNEFLRMRANHLMPDPNGVPEPRYPEPGKVYTCFHRKKDGSLFPAEVSIGVFKQNNDVLITTIVRDVSERQKAEERVRESEERFRLITENSHDFISLLDLNGNYVYASPSHFSLLGYTNEQLMQLKPISLVHPEDLNPNFSWNKINEGEIRLRKADGTYIWTEGTSYMIKIRDIDYIVGIARDVTARRNTEEKLRESIREKDVLLAEVHHRVRNNLSIISSLLRLQTATLTDEASIAALQESHNRIRSMLLIHEKLYQSEQFSRIDFKVYVHDLVKYITRTYPLQGTDVTVSVLMENIHLSLTSAVPCGLILNELLSNAYKYAFKGRQKGRILIKASKTNKQITFSISDDGVGINPEVDLRHLKSLGLNLVQKLTLQLDGHLKISSKKGTHFELTFQPKNDQKL